MEDLLLTAAQFINTTSSHIFLTGKAGTGKTTFLKNLKSVTHKSFIVVAPTGIAALNAGGVTIHSQFLLPPATFLPDRFLPVNFSEGGNFINQNVLAQKHPMNSVRKQVLRSIDLLVIDEVSMLRADLLDAIDYRMKAARNNFKQSFGGVQVLFIGDLYQLSPVVRQSEKETLSKYYNSFWFYEAKALQNNQPVYIELTKIFRQHDPYFIGILNNLRHNLATHENIDILNQYFKTEAEIGSLSEVVTLTTHNAKADEINLRELKKLTTPSHIFKARLEGEFPESLFPVSPNIELKVGAQIMFTRNDNEEKMYFNGKLATVTEIKDDEVKVELAETHQPYGLKRERWENKKYTLNKTTNTLDDEVVGTFEQFPIKLAWAITIHKSQGLTFDKAIIDVGHAFADGQVYVALSRLRSLHGLSLRTRIPPTVISTDKQVVEYTNANHKPDEMGNTMKAHQQVFIQHLIDSTFDFSVLIKIIHWAVKEPIGLEKETMEGMKSVPTQIAEALQAERANTDRFRIQLAGLLTANEPDRFLERIEKGCAYYKNILLQCLEKLLRHKAEMSHQKRIKTYLNNLSEIDQALSKQIETVDKSRYLASGILKGEDKFDFELLTAQRIAKRKEIEARINREIKPIERKAKKKKKNQTDELSTYDTTLQMLNSGMDVKQIAKERGLVPSTIEGHLAKAVEAGRISIYKFIDEPSVAEVVNAREQLHEGFTSKDLYEMLKGKFSYGQLRAVTNHLMLQNSDNKK
ncbi:MAG: helix-turn-helix domain-containing protein [Bacteroidetes bacterium]|nr:helix-turn-helix domain-containing protein [Bacteroidota bacterium]